MLKKLNDKLIKGEKLERKDKMILILKVNKHTGSHYYSKDYRGLEAYVEEEIFSKCIETLDIFQRVDGSFLVECINEILYFYEIMEKDRNFVFINMNEILLFKKNIDIRLFNLIIKKTKNNKIIYIE